MDLYMDLYISENASKVYVDDAPWQRNEEMKLHPRLSADDGRILGCTSGLHSVGSVGIAGASVSWY